MIVTPTPGPWHVIDSWRNATAAYMDLHEREIFILAEDTSEPSIAHIASLGKSASEEIHEREMANARLIAAAPELYAAAVEAENWFDNHGDEDDEGAQQLLRMFRAAITKAEHP